MHAAGRWLCPFELGAREELLNGVGNLLGMLMTFLGGAWMPLSLMGSAVQTVAHFVPTYWVNDAISKALASDLTSAVLSDIACDLASRCSSPPPLPP